MAPSAELPNLHLPPPSPALHPPRAGPLFSGAIPLSDQNPFFARQLQATLSRSSSTASITKLADGAVALSDAEDDADDSEDGVEPLFIGFDCSTQALKCSLLDSALEVIAELEVRFDRDLPHFKTKGGTLTGKEGSGEVFSPVMLSVEAIDLLCERMKEKRWPTHRIKAVSAAGQQHASVYWSRKAGTLLSTLTSKKTMASQLEGAFSRQIVPNWQDSSTTQECRDMEKAVGGSAELAQICGSRAHERFTGPQIARFRREEPEAYEATDRISLVSSFITTLLCADGEIKGIDESDACGMNLWDMNRPERGWNEHLLAFCAGEAYDASKGEMGPKAQELSRKLGVVESDGGRPVGKIGKWFVNRYGFNPDCLVCPGTGDNPATYLSFVLGDSEALLSLGTSDTVLVSTTSYKPHPEFHTFAHPAQVAPLSKEEVAAGYKGVQPQNSSEAAPLRYFAMLVYKNGSLARENVRDADCDGSWDAFNEAVEETEKQDEIKEIGYYWYKPDIIPSGAHKIHRFTQSSDGADASSWDQVDSFEKKEKNAGAILESQFLNYRYRSSNILSAEGKGDEGDSADPPTLRRAFAVGGAAANPTIVQTLSDVLGCDICKPVIELEDDDDDDAASVTSSAPPSEAGDSDAEASTPPATPSVDGRPSAQSGKSRKRKTRNADFNSCSVAAAYKAKWCYVRQYNAMKRQQQHGNGDAQQNGAGDSGKDYFGLSNSSGAGANEVTFEDMFNNSKQIRRLRRAVAKQLRINTRAAAATTLGGADGAKSADAPSGHKTSKPKKSRAAQGTRPGGAKGRASFTIGDAFGKLQMPKIITDPNNKKRHEGAEEDEEDDEDDEESEDEDSAVDGGGEHKLAKQARLAALRLAEAEASEHEEGVAVVASPREGKKELYKSAVGWWKQLEERAVESCTQGKGGSDK